MQVSIGKQFHIGLEKSSAAGYAILPGDPGRVEKIAAYLDNPSFVAQNREFTTWQGFLSGEKVLVTSTGIGGPSASIAVEELAKIGVHTMIRIGTCGGIASQVCAGDLVLPTGAIRMEGTSKEYVPIEYPAVPSFQVLQALVQAAQALDFSHHTGVVQCKDSFYGQHAPESMPNFSELDAKWQAWKKMGVLASEMETAALFTVAAARGLRAAAVLFTVWNQEREKQGLSNKRLSDTAPAIKTAVEAIRLLIAQEKQSHL